MDEWYNAVQAQVNLAKYPLKQPKSCTETFSGLSCKMTNLYPEQSVMGVFRQVPSKQGVTACKKMKSSKATVHHIKQVAGDPQAVQINLLRHQCTELPAGKYKKKKSSVKSRQANHKQHGN